MSRELDVQVARVRGLEVMGWEYAVRDHDDLGHWRVSPWKEGEKQPVYLAHCNCDIRDELVIPGYEHDGWLDYLDCGHMAGCLEVVPFFSSDIATVWELGADLAGDEVAIFIETLCDLCGIEQEMLYWDGMHWASIEALNMLVYATPEQRCRAFLAAKGIDIE